MAAPRQVQHTQIFYHRRLGPVIEEMTGKPPA
jgi:hypothetical protein